MLLLTILKKIDYLFTRRNITKLVYQPRLWCWHYSYWVTSHPRSDRFCWKIIVCETIYYLEKQSYLCARSCSQFISCSVISVYMKTFGILLLHKPFQKEIYCVKDMRSTVLHVQLLLHHPTTLQFCEWHFLSMLITAVMMHFCQSRFVLWCADICILCTLYSNTVECTNCLLCRGTNIINEELVKRVQHRKTLEANVVNKIKNKMERIKLRQVRLGQPEATDHYVGQCCHFQISHSISVICP